MAGGTIESAIQFHQFTPPMQMAIRDVAATRASLTSLCPRPTRALVDGKPGKNPAPSGKSVLTSCL